MKNLHPLYLFLLLASITSFSIEKAEAQCMPDTVTYKSPGIWPDSTMNIPPACVGEPYQTVVTAIVPYDTTFFGFTWTINWLQVVDVVGLPPGFSYLCSYPNCQIPGDTTGCVLLQGTAQAGMGGTYSITVYSAAQAYHPSFGTQTVYDTLHNFYRLVVGEPTVNLQDAQICPGSSVTLDAGNPGASYLWSTTATTQTINVSTASDFSVTVTDGNGCSASDTATVSIGSALSVDLGPDGILCEGNFFQLDAGFSGSTYQWSSGATTQTVTVDTSGTYSVTVTDANSCTGTDATMWTVNPKPNADAGTDVDICEGDNTTLSASGGTSYSWSTTETTASITVSPNSATTYKVTVTDNNGCQNNDSVTVNVNSLPSVNIGNNITQCDSVTLDAGNASAQFVWSTGASTQQVTVYGSGNYGVTVTDANGCVDTDDVNVVIDTCVGIKEVNITELVSVYPNPGNGNFILELPQSQNNDLVFDVRIVNIYGQHVQELQLNAAQQHYLDLTNTPAGIYFIRISSGNKQAVKILVKE